MNKLNKIYERNRALDKIYKEKYSSSVSDFHYKNTLEFIIELGEFVNETKCFKYWTIKKPNREDLLEEYADCITMALYQFNHYGMEEVVFVETPDYDNVLFEINDLYKVATRLMEDDKSVAIEVFSRLYKLREKFDISEEDILESCLKKIKKSEERLEGDY